MVRSSAMLPCPISLLFFSKLANIMLFYPLKIGSIVIVLCCTCIRACMHAGRSDQGGDVGREWRVRVGHGPCLPHRQHQDQRWGHHRRDRDHLHPLWVDRDPTLRWNRWRTPWGIYTVFVFVVVVIFFFPRVIDLNPSIASYIYPFLILVINLRLFMVDLCVLLPFLCVFFFLYILNLNPNIASYISALDSIKQAQKLRGWHDHE